MNRCQLPDSNWGAFDHASHNHAPQLLSDNYYVFKVLDHGLFCRVSREQELQGNSMLIMVNESLQDLRSYQ